MLRQAKKSDIRSLTRIHLLELHSDFLPSLGEKFLNLLYLSLLQSKMTFIYVYEINKNVQGFIVGSENFDYDFKKIILKKFIKFIIVLFPQIIKNFTVARNIFDTLLYTKKENSPLKAELIIIAVSRQYHRKGIGRKLILHLEENFTNSSINRYKVSVNKNNFNANLFYKSVGFIKQNEFLLYGKKINLYTKKIQ